MCFRLIGLSLFVLATVLPAAGVEDEAIRQLIGRYLDVRNGKSAESLRDLFTADADQLVSTGQWRRGVDALVAGATASSKKENGQSQITVESVRMVGGECAIAESRYETTTAGSATGTAAARRMWSTFVLQKTGSGWRIAAIRNMLPSPAQP